MHSLPLNYPFFKQLNTFEANSLSKLIKLRETLKKKHKFIKSSTHLKMQPSRKKQKSTAAPETDEDLLRKKFKCVKCSVQLQDVKLLKLHFWKVHIQQNEIINHMNVDDKYLVKTTFKKKTPTKFESKKRKRMADVEDNSDSENVDNTSANVSLTEEEKLIDKVNKLTGDEIRWFNLTQTQINEQEIADFYQPMDESAQFNKSE